MINTIASLLVSMGVTLSAISGVMPTVVNFNSYNTEVAVPVLCYHHFVKDEGDITTTAWTTTEEKFEQDILSLLEEGYTFISTKDLYTATKNETPLPKKPIVLTFDDGYSSNYNIAFPILEKYDVKADIFIVTSMVGMAEVGMFPHFTWEEAREMEESGLVDIYLHGQNHQGAMTQRPDLFFQQYVQGQKEIVEKLGKRDVAAYCYPGGDYSYYTVEGLVALGAQVQYIWSGEEKKDIMNYPFLLRENVTYTTDVRALVKKQVAYLDDKLKNQWN